MVFKVDIHTHILPEAWPDLKERFGYGGWVRMDRSCDGCQARILKDNGQIFRIVDQNCWSPDARFDDMDATGVNVQLLSTVPVMFSYWAKSKDALNLCQLLNDHIASVVAKNPKRFVGAATLPLQDPMLAVEELRRCVTDLGMRAVEIGSHVNDWNLDTRALDPVYKTAEELKCPIFVHPWDMETGGRMAKYWLPWLVGMPAETTSAICNMIFGGVFERFPSLKVCFAHGGGAFPYTVGRIQHGFQVKPDLCATVNNVPPINYLGRIYTDSLVHNEEALRLLVNIMGEDRVLLGSDYPFPLGEHRPGNLITDMPDFGTKIKEKIMGKNAMEFLGLSIEDFL